MCVVASFRSKFFRANVIPATYRLKLDIIQSEAHRQLSLRAALESVVLLKNDDVRGLPMKPSMHRVCVIGPFIDNTAVLFGDYSPTLMVGISLWKECWIVDTLVVLSAKSVRSLRSFHKQVSLSEVLAYIFLGLCFLAGLHCYSSGRDQEEHELEPSEQC